MYRYITYTNALYIDVLPHFVKAYNNTVHTATGMAHAAVTGKHVLAIWTPMNNKRSRIHIGIRKFRVGQHVRISKEKINFAKRSETDFSENFRITKVISR